MQLEEAIIKRIYDLCNERGLSINKLATLAGLNSSTIKSIIARKSKNTGARTLLDICQALDMTLYDFFDDPMFKTKDLEGTY